jgi:hypothetical protein
MPSQAEANTATQINPRLLPGDAEFLHPIDERGAINSEPHSGTLWTSDNPGVGRSYEWRTIGGTKIPFAIGMKDDRPFAFAGLWDGWKD